MLSALMSVKQNLVISEPAILAAIDRLVCLPFSKTGSMPKIWGREWVLQCVRDGLKSRKNGALSADTCVPVGPGLWAIVVPFGYDLAGISEAGKRVQVCLLIRPVGTDPKLISEI